MFWNLWRTWGGICPVPKTDDMDIPVGVAQNGKLFADGSRVQTLETRYQDVNDLARQNAEYIVDLEHTDIALGRDIDDLDLRVQTLEQAGGAQAGTAKLVQGGVEYANVYWSIVGKQVFLTFGDLSSVIMLGSTSYTITGLPNDLVVPTTMLTVVGPDSATHEDWIAIQIAKTANNDMTLLLVGNVLMVDKSASPATFTTTGTNSYYLQYAANQTVIVRKSN